MGTQIPTSVTIIDSLLGFQAVSLTNMGHYPEELSILPTIAAGSKVEVAGAFFTFASETTPQATTWAAITTGANAYITVTPSGTAGSQILTSKWTSTPPEWSTSKQGWYTSSGSSIRIIALSEKRGAAWAARKTVAGTKQENHILKRVPSGNWRKTGESIGIGTNNHRVAALSSTLVATVSVTGNEIQAYEWNGLAFATSGTALTIPKFEAGGIAALDDTYVVVATGDADGPAITTYRWTGSTFATAGTALAIPTGPTSICAISDAVIAISDNARENITAYTWSGSAWSTTGSALTVPALNNSSITALSQSMVAVFNPGGSSLTSYSWSGSAFATVGTALSVACDDSQSTVASLDGPTVVQIDAGGNGEFRTYEWDGAEWTQVGTSYDPAAGGAVSLSVLDSNTVVLFDASSDELEAYATYSSWI